MIVPASFLKCMSSADRALMGKAGLTETEAYQAFANREEKLLHKLIYNELTRAGIVAIHSRMDKRSTTAIGIPDFCFVVKGVPFAVEVKGPNGKLSVEQETTIERMKKNGWNCFVVRTFDEFRDCLEKSGLWNELG